MSIIEKYGVELTDSEIENLGHSFDALGDSIELTKLYTAFTTIERIPRVNGRRENDAEHTFHLAIIATELAANLYPDLDTGLIAEYCLAHDLPETITGDVNTFGMPEKDRKKKLEVDQFAASSLARVLPKHQSDILKRYEAQQDLESKLCRLVDKLTPSMTHLLSGDHNTVKEDCEVSNGDEYYDKLFDSAVALQREFPEFPEIHLIHKLLILSCVGHVFADERHPVLQEPIPIASIRRRILGREAAKKGTPTPRKKVASV